MPDRLTPLLATRPWLLADGATGSNLFNRGLQSGDAPELWNIDHPQRIAELERAFIEAGADIILTNTFGGTRYRLQLHKAGARVAELNEAAAGIARREADGAGRTVLVGGSIGPTGELMQPLGALSQDEATRRLCRAGRRAGSGRGGFHVDRDHVLGRGNRSGHRRCPHTGLPVVATLSFDTNGRTMMGITPSELAGLHRKHRSRGLRQ